MRFRDSLIVYKHLHFHIFRYLVRYLAVEKDFQDFRMFYGPRFSGNFLDLDFS